MLNHNETKEILSHADVVEETKKIGVRLSNNFLRTIPNCTACGKEMQFVEGDIIYGEKWYHNGCLKYESRGKTNV
ncbi:MAG TPA: hypothetical protein VFP45_04135 [Candidatus Nitrosotalea sp.]|nr:hypothetical protein [Candidatus Nitrosotalea sp.]